MSFQDQAAALPPPAADSFLPLSPARELCFAVGTGSVSSRVLRESVNHQRAAALAVQRVMHLAYLRAHLEG